MNGSPFYTDLDFLNGIRNSDPLAEKAFYEQHYGMINLLLYRLRSNSRIKTSQLAENDFAEETENDLASKDKLEILALQMVKKLAYPCSEIMEDWYLNK